jgi:lipoyl synthase
LRGVGCDVVTLGQYLQPTPQHAPIARFYTPEEFGALAELCRGMGFMGVASGPFVRSSYNAAEVYERMRVSP